MRRWGPRSQQVRNQLDPRLQDALDWVLENVADMSLIEGHRDEQRQNLLYGTGMSQVKWPKSKHNALPSLAVDLQPYPCPGEEDMLREHLCYIAGAMIAYGKANGFTIRWGGDWNMNGRFEDNSFDDLFHFEIKE